MVVARMLGVDASEEPVASDFGVRLSGANLEDHLRHMREARRAYARKFPVDVAEVERMAAETAALRPTRDNPGAFERGPVVPCPACEA